MASIVIDPGHGGSATVGGSSWNNAVGPKGTLEKTHVLAIGLLVGQALRAAGQQVTLTRQSDVNLGLKDRAKVARQLKAPVFVSIHLNGSKSHTAQGTETLVHTAHSPASARLSLAVQDALLPVTGLTDRNKAFAANRIKPQSLGVLRPDQHALATAACLVEISFMDIADEEARLRTESYRKAVAEAIAKGILTYLGVATASVLQDMGDAIELEAADAGVTDIDRFLGQDETASVAAAKAATPTDDPGEQSGPPKAPFTTAFLTGTGLPNALIAGEEPWPDMADFRAFIAGLGLRHFEPDEFLVMGNQNKSGSCKGKNTFPPRNLWPRLTNTARMIDAIRTEMQSAIRITSCYRSPAYNSCIGGESASLHMQFNAIDFVCNSGTPEIWRRVAARLRDEVPAFKGGIGRYGSFVHIDTRGTIANWVG